MNKHECEAVELKKKLLARLDELGASQAPVPRTPRPGISIVIGMNGRADIGPIVGNEMDEVRRQAALEQLPPRE